MKQSFHRTTIMLLFWLIAGIHIQAEKLMEGVSYMDFCGYKNCPVLSNAMSRVVLGPQCGGRVLEYSLGGVNVIALDPKQDGWFPVAGQPAIDPYGGRFDIGPEMVIPRHPDLWVGPWHAEATGARMVRMTSLADKPTGVQLVREFELARDSSHLRCRQIIKNVSDMPKAWCHWSRTLAVGGGICVIPLTPGSRFPNKYIRYDAGTTINYRPQDPAIAINDDFLIIRGTPSYPKLGMDSYAGWFSYLMKNNVMFIKRFPVYPERVYNEIAALTISIYYYQDRICELEPIGPRQNILPGKSSDFTEDWYLAPFDYPKDGNVNPTDVKRIIENLSKI